MLLPATPSPVTVTDADRLCVPATEKLAFVDNRTDWDAPVAKVPDDTVAVNVWVEAPVTFSVTVALLVEKSIVFAHY